MEIAPICQVLPKLRGFEHWHMQLEITASLLRIPNLADQDRDHLLLFICLTLSTKSGNFCQLSYQGKLLFYICKILIFVNCLR